MVQVMVMRREEEEEMEGDGEEEEIGRWSSMLLLIAEYLFDPCDSDLSDLTCILYMSTATQT